MSETLEALRRRIAECERQEAEITTLKARISEQAERIASLNDRLAETQMLAHRWMEAHDARAAGVSYEFPKPADLPERIAALEAELKRADALPAVHPDTERMDALEAGSGINVSCDEDHVVHSPGCVLLYRNGTLMKLIRQEENGTLHWRRVSWRAAIDAARSTEKGPE